MKKTLALIMAIMMLSLAFTACSKKGDENTSPETETTQKAEDGAEQNTEAAQPDQSYEAENNEGTEMSEFESLIDTFNNSEDEEEREKARIELERILEQAEQQAQ